MSVQDAPGAAVLTKLKCVGWGRDFQAHVWYCAHLPNPVRWLPDDTTVTTAFRSEMSLARPILDIRLHGTGATSFLLVHSSLF